MLILTHLGCRERLGRFAGLQAAAALHHQGYHQTKPCMLVARLGSASLRAVATKRAAQPCMSPHSSPCTVTASCPSAVVHPFHLNLILPPCRHHHKYALPPPRAPPRCPFRHPNLNPLTPQAPPQVPHGLSHGLVLLRHCPPIQAEYYSSTPQPPSQVPHGL